MKLFLIIIVSIFVIVFIAGMIYAAIKGGKKQRRGYAIMLLAQLPNGVPLKLRDIFKAHKNGEVNQVNQITSTIDSGQMQQIISLLSPQNRPSEFSSGATMDNVSWLALEKGLQDNGYSNEAAKIIAGIVHHSLDYALKDMKSDVNK